LEKSDLKPLLIRADAGTQMGTGHVMRCLALAQAWQDFGGTAHFATVDLPDELAARLGIEGMALHRMNVVPGSHEDATQTAILSHDLEAAWVVEDGYHFGADYQRIIKDSGLLLLAIDDYGHAGHYVADLVLNQNIYADASMYPSREPRTRLLLGTQYVLLRREFFRRDGRQRGIPAKARKVLVTMGGSDPHNVTLMVIQSLKQIDISELKIKIVVGSANPNVTTLEKEIFGYSNYELIKNVANMPELMAWSDIAVAAGGSTCWELAFMGLPHMIFILAENQRPVAEGLDTLGAGFNLGWNRNVSQDKFIRKFKEIINDPAGRKKMSEEGKRLIDGIGSKRVADAMTISDNQDDFQIRTANLEDAKLLWLWANDSIVRANSFQSDPISSDEHTEWYQKKLASRDTSFWIIVKNQVPVAQIRYDCINKYEANVSFSVAHDYRGKGIGTKVLTLTFDAACKALRVKRAKGLVFISNQASQRTFIDAGYENIGLKQVSGKWCFVFVKEFQEIKGETL